MSARSVPPTIQAIDTWRRRPVFRASIVNSYTAAVVVKSTRSLKVGRRISFARLSELQGSAPRDWRSAVIWRIEKRCLHLTRT
jgi:hypothetical protein